MSENDELYKKILDNLSDGVYFVDRDRRINYWNKGAEQITGFTAERIVGHFCQDNLLNHVTENGVKLCQNGCPLHATIADGKPREAEIYLHHVDGYRIPVLVRTTPIRDANGNITGAVETFSNNSSLHTMRQQVHRLKDTILLDPLTRIGNRRYMKQKLGTALLEYRQRGVRFGILFMDIDHFKQVNDTYGHETGDKVLSMVANTLRFNMRSEDAIARWGGDEFIILAADVNKAGLTGIAEKMRRLTESSSLRLNGKSLDVTVSIGATLVQEDDNLASVIRRADQTMYSSKQAGRNRVTTA